MHGEDDSYDPEEGARPSSLIAVHKLSTPDPLRDLHLMRDLEIINARTRAELGPITHGEALKSGERMPSRGSNGRDRKVTIEADQVEENETMKLKDLAKVSLLGAAVLGSAGALSSERGQSSPTEQVGAKVPHAFQRYTATPAGSGNVCVVGAVGDEDAMNRRPYVYLARAEDGQVLWVRSLSIPKEFYEGRATHCLRKGQSLYVLIQVDTQSQRTLSQTVVSVVKLRAEDGLIEDDVEVVVPGSRAAYSAWVRGKNGLRQVHDGLQINGQYRYMDSDDDLPFSITMAL
jgi:hypothetical protein